MSLINIGNTISRFCVEPQSHKYAESMKDLLLSLRGKNKRTLPKCIIKIDVKDPLARKVSFSRYKSNQSVETNFVKNYRKPVMGTALQSRSFYQLSLDKRMLSSRNKSKVSEDGLNLSFSVDSIQQIFLFAQTAFRLLQVNLPNPLPSLPVPRRKRVTWVFPPYIDEPFTFIFNRLAECIQGQSALDFQPGRTISTLAKSSFVPLLHSPRMQKDIVKDESEQDDNERTLKKATIPRKDHYIVAKPQWFSNTRGSDLVSIAMCSKLGRRVNRLQIN